MKYLTREEIDQLIAERGLREDIHLSEIFRSIRIEMTHGLEKLPGMQEPYQFGNADAFVDAVKRYLGEDRVEVEELSNGNKTITIDGIMPLHVTSIDVSIELENSRVQVRLHREYFDTIIKALFDEQGVCYPLYKTYAALHSTCWHLIHLEDALRDEKKIREALKDSNRYDEIRAEYEAIYAELHSYAGYSRPRTWEESLQKYGVEVAKGHIQDIQAKAKNKTQDQCARMKKRYEDAQLMLQGAVDHGLINDTACLVPWDEFIGALTGDKTENDLRTAYLTGVAKAYEEAIAKCAESGTAYMTKKRKKMEADMALCEQLKATYGMDCFIDRSMFSRAVCHLNILLSDNSVIMFRIGNVTPTEQQAGDILTATKALESISATTGKVLKMVSYTPRNKSSLRTEEKSDLGAQLLEMLKFVKGGELEFKPQMVNLTVPVKNQGFVFSVRKKSAIEEFGKIVEDLKTFVKLNHKYGDFDIKGIVKEKEPYL